MDIFDISAQLKKRRVRMGLSLTQLARKIDTSPAALSRYENGWHRFEIYTLNKNASALGCRLRVMLDPITSPRPTGGASAVKKLRRLFWDRTLHKRDLDNYPLWVIERVLDYGTLADVQALLDIVGRKQFLEAAASINFKSPRTRCFWAQILRKEGISCTKKYSRKAARTCWPG